MIITWLSQEVVFICPKSEKSVGSVPLDLYGTISESCSRNIKNMGSPQKREKLFTFCLLKVRIGKCCLKEKNVDEIQSLMGMSCLGLFFSGD